MSVNDEDWETFENHCEDYLNRILSGSIDVPAPLNWADLINDFGYGYIGEFQLVGGSNSNFSDLKILDRNGGDSGWWVEVKKRSAQCGQLIVETDSNGNYCLADSEVGYIVAEDSEVVPTAEDGSVEEEPWSDDLLQVEAYNASVQDLLNHMNGIVEKIEGAPVDLDPEEIQWEAKRFADGALSCEVIKEHYRAKNVCYFITKTQGHRYSDDECFILIPLEQLHNYAQTWAEYRNKPCGSGMISKTQYDEEGEFIIADALSNYYGLDMDAGDAYFDEDVSYGYIVRTAPGIGPLDCNAVHSVPGSNYRYKLLYKEKDRDGETIYQIRQLSNSERPTVVFKMRVRNEIQPNYEMIGKSSYRIDPDEFIG